MEEGQNSSLMNKYSPRVIVKRGSFPARARGGAGTSTTGMNQHQRPTLHASGQKRAIPPMSSGKKTILLSPRAGAAGNGRRRTPTSKWSSTSTTFKQQ